ncbi:unnamed protein product, partial [Mesorhabditis spiculigera]
MNFPSQNLHTRPFHAENSYNPSAYMASEPQFLQHYAAPRAELADGQGWGSFENEASIPEGQPPVFATNGSNKEDQPGPSTPQPKPRGRPRKYHVHGKNPEENKRFSNSLACKESRKIKNQQMDEARKLVVRLKELSDTLFDAHSQQRRNARPSMDMRGITELRETIGKLSALAIFTKKPREQK